MTTPKRNALLSTRTDIDDWNIFPVRLSLFYYQPCWKILGWDSLRNTLKVTSVIYKCHLRNKTKSFETTVIVKIKGEHWNTFINTTFFQLKVRKNNQSSISDADRKSQFADHRIMSESRFSALSADFRVRNFRSASETNDTFYYLYIS